MAKRNVNDIRIASYDDLFKTEEQRQEDQLEKVVRIKIKDISDFKDHPFKVRMDEDMLKLIDSVKENGVLVPTLVRPKKDGQGYEMISGHRRKYATDYNGIDEIDAIVRDLDDDQATIIMVDSNIQRENILPSERGFAYKMRLEAMKHQGKRVDLTSGQVVQKLGKTSIQQLGDEIGENYKQIQRYIRLTYLIEPLRDMVDGQREDGITMALNPAYEVSFLKIDEQKELAEVIEDVIATPSLVQARILKQKSQEGTLDQDEMIELLSMEKPNQKEKISFRMEEIDAFFPKHFTPKQKKDIIIKLLANYSKKRDKEVAR